jgi:hypothetical protein
MNFNGFHFVNKSGDYTLIARISEITDEGIFVIVPKLGGQGIKFGPCKRLADIRPVTGVDGESTQTLYGPGVDVLVTTIMGRPDDLVVLGVLQ